MNAFLVLVLLLTIAYIVYYGIVVSQDIIVASKSGEPTVETIDVSSMADGQVTTVEVHETPQGFRIGSQETRTSTTKANAPAASAAPAVPDSKPAPAPSEATEAAPASSSKSSADVEEAKQEMKSTVKQFDIEGSMTDYSRMIEGIGAKCEVGMYEPKDGAPVIVNVITPKASDPVPEADEDENVLENNSHKTHYDNI